jgi:hypothetical protein
VFPDNRGKGVPVLQVLRVSQALMAIQAKMAKMEPQVKMAMVKMAIPE